MKRALLLAGLLALAACSQAPVSPTDSAGLATQKLSTAADDSAVGVAAHTGSGAVYVLTGAYSANYDTGEYLNDVFLRRYDRGGSVVWQRQLGQEEYDRPQALATDPSGYVYVGYNDRLEKRRADGNVVWSRAEKDRDLGALTTDKAGNVYTASTNGMEVFVSKYTAAGSRLWTKALADDRSTYFTARALSTDADGNLYVLALVLDDAYAFSNLYKLSPSGKQLFATTVNDGGKDIKLADLEVRGGALYVAGTYYADYMGDENGPDGLDGFVAKFSLDGGERWRKVFGTPSSDGAGDLSVDASGNLYVTGFTSGNMGGVRPGGSDAFLRKFSANGGTLWTKQIGSSGDDYGNAVVAYSSGELYLAGEAGGALADTTPRGGQDAFLRRTDGSGNRVWTDQ